MRSARRRTGQPAAPASTRNEMASRSICRSEQRAVEELDPSSPSPVPSLYHLASRSRLHLHLCMSSCLSGSCFLSLMLRMSLTVISQVEFLAHDTARTWPKAHGRVFCLLSDSTQPVQYRPIAARNWYDLIYLACCRFIVCYLAAFLIIVIIIFVTLLVAHVARLLFSVLSVLSFLFILLLYYLLYATFRGE